MVKVYLRLRNYILSNIRGWYEIRLINSRYYIFYKIRRKNKWLWKLYLQFEEQPIDQLKGFFKYKTFTHVMQTNIKV